MENVPEVVGTKNIKHFAEWLATLDGLGYKSKWQILNATDFNVPQNRERCFMVSVLGDYYYDFPTPSGCKLKLKDVLEKNVDESYYLKTGTIIKLAEHKERHEAQGHGFGWKPINPDGGGQFARTIKTESGYRPDTNFIIEQAREADRETDRHGVYTNGSGLQGVRQPAYERSNGNYPPPRHN